MNLEQFTGTFDYYRHSLFKGYQYTDGVSYLIDKGNCYWLVTDIFAYQDNKLKKQKFQHWTLIKHDDNSATLKATDGNKKVLKLIKIEYTDFPLKTVELFLIENTLMLTSEY